MRPNRTTKIVASLAAVLFLTQAVGAASTAKPRKRKRPAPAPVPLVWHVETLAGDEVSTLDGETPINPASVVKVATTLWALEKLGPEHRFDTRFEATGTVNAKGVLSGDLVVRGGADPDFHPENVFLVAARLNALGIRQIGGSVRVDGRFWIGWEGGSERVIKVPEQRTVMMAQRLRSALDPKRWTSATRRTWNEFAARYALPATKPPGVTVLGGAGAVRGAPEAARPLLVHRSKPLLDTLRRFDAYSNNDIERLGDSLGTPAEMATHIAEALGMPVESVQLQTISGLGTNRMTPRLVVKLLRHLRTTCERLGLSIESVLPVAGCDPGTLNHSFARLCTGPCRMSMVAKTGTLTYTDGGAAVLAGFVNTGRGDLVFCVAAPGASGRLGTARRQQGDWVERLVAASDGPRVRTCAAPLGYPEGDSKVLDPASAGLGVAAVR